MADVSRQSSMTTQEIIAAIGQLGLVDLEKVTPQVAQLRTRQVTGLEAELLQTARRRPRAFERRYRELIRLRQEETLTEAQYEELLRLTDEAEAFDTRRINLIEAGVVWVDVLVLISNREAAYVFSKEGNQITMYALNSGEVIATEGTGAPSDDLPTSQQRLHRLAVHDVYSVQETDIHD